MLELIRFGLSKQHSLDTVGDWGGPAARKHTEVAHAGTQQKIHKETPHQDGVLVQLHDCWCAHQYQTWHSLDLALRGLRGNESFNGEYRIAADDTAESVP